MPAQASYVHRGPPSPPRRLHFPLSLLLLVLIYLPLASSHGLGPRRARIHAFSPEGVVMVGFDWWEEEGMGGSGCGKVYLFSSSPWLRLGFAAKTALAF